MGSAFSWSLAAHAVFIISFLLLSATRQPLSIPQVVRPVRLVTYLEPVAAPRQRATAPSLPDAPRGAPAPADPRMVAPPAPAQAAPVVVPHLAIPVRASAPAPAPSSKPVPPAGAQPSLLERLERNLTASAPATASPADIAPPQLASLPPAATPAPAPSTERSVPASSTAQPGDVVPVGYFPHDWYLAMLRKNIFDRWLPPPDVFKTSRSPTAVVSFRIDRAGRVSSVALREGSGSARFDTSAVAVIQGLGQVSALPEQYAEESLDVVIRFQNQK